MSVYSSDQIPIGTMRMIAHTGYSAVAPGNTLPAFIAAGESGFWGAECDIRRTKDGVWILSHDEKVDSLTDGTGRIAEMTFDEIMRLRVDVGSGIENYPNLKLATFVEYLDVCKRYGLHPVIEIKPEEDTETLHEITEILCAREEKERFIVICFNRAHCIRLKELMPELSVYYLIGFENITQEDIDFAVENHLDGMDIHVFLPDDFAKAVKNAGLDVIVWTIDDMENCERCYKLGINAITTNSLTPKAPQGTTRQKSV